LTHNKRLGKDQIFYYAIILICLSAKLSWLELVAAGTHFWARKEVMLWKS